MSRPATDKPGAGCVGALTEALRAAGDLALVPAARPGHGLASTPDEELAPWDALTGSATALDLAGCGAKTSLIHVAFEPASPVGRLLASRPAVVVRAGSHRQCGMLDASLRLLAAELVHEPPGPSMAVHRLVDLLVLQLLRAWMAQDHHLDGVQWHPTAPADETVTAALDLTHTDPARPWTIGTLAAEVGLSRAAFIRRFTAAVGQPPSTYLTRWRLATAANHLRGTSEPLVTIAREVGYSSEFTFSRAFHRAYGQRPGRYRAAARRWASREIRAPTSDSSDRRPAGLSLSPADARRSARDRSRSAMGATTTSFVHRRGRPGTTLLPVGLVRRGRGLGVHPSGHGLEPGHRPGSGPPAPPEPRQHRHPVRDPLPQGLR
jgi:AraC-like DNA-binding protein